MRYAGFLDQRKLNAVATKLADDGRYYDEDKNFSIRLVLISQTPANKDWERITNILDKNIIDFFVNVWGMCWVDTGIGSASIHDQWDDLIKQIFLIINDQTIEDVEERKVLVKKLLQQDEPVKIINIDKKILGGTPVFNGSRVPIKNLFDYLETGETIITFWKNFLRLNESKLFNC